MSVLLPITATARQSFGQAGATFETGTTAVTGTFCAITFIEDSIFTVLTMVDQDGDDMSTAAVSFPKGLTIYGQITAFTLASGKVLAYKAV